MSCQDTISVTSKFLTISMVQSGLYMIGYRTLKIILKLSPFLILNEELQEQEIQIKTKTQTNTSQLL